MFRGRYLSFGDTSQSHKAVTCDGCGVANFTGICHRCLVCDDYKLCNECKLSGVTSIVHSNDHPMESSMATSSSCFDSFLFEQLIGTPFRTTEEEKNYQCPFCLLSGLCEYSLAKHILKLHSSEDGYKTVVCPICAKKPGGDPSFRSADIFGHISNHLQEIYTRVNGELTLSNEPFLSDKEPIRTRLRVPDDNLFRAFLPLSPLNRSSFSRSSRTNTISASPKKTKKTIKKTVSSIPSATTPTSSSPSTGKKQLIKAHRRAAFLQELLFSSFLTSSSDACT